MTHIQQSDTSIIAQFVPQIEDLPGAYRQMIFDKPMWSYVMQLLGMTKDIAAYGYPEDQDSRKRMTMALENAEKYGATFYALSSKPEFDVFFGLMRRSTNDQNDPAAYAERFMLSKEQAKRVIEGAKLRQIAEAQKIDTMHDDLKAAFNRMANRAHQLGESGIITPFWHDEESMPLKDTVRQLEKLAAGAERAQERAAERAYGQAERRQRKFMTIATDCKLLADEIVDAIDPLEDRLEAGDADETDGGLTVRDNAETIDPQHRYDEEVA